MAHTTVQKIAVLLAILATTTLFLAPTLGFSNGTRVRYVKIYEDGTKEASLSPLDGSGSKTPSTVVRQVIDPRISTNTPTQEGVSFARVSATYFAPECSMIALFTYGENPAQLNSITSTFQTVKTIGSFEKVISGLKENTKYYYQAEAVGCGQIVKGPVRSFTTQNEQQNPIQTTPVTQPDPTPETGITGQFIPIEQEPVLQTTPEDMQAIETNSYVHVSITNETTVVSPGEEITYTVDIRNILRNRPLENVTVEISLPPEVRFISATKGSYNQESHTLTIQVNDLVKEGSYTVFIQGEIVIKSAKDSDLVVAKVVVTFDHPLQEGVRSTKIAFDSDRLEQKETSGFLASVRTSNIFPGTFGGWLLMIVILGLLIVAVRYILTPVKQEISTREPRNYPYRPTNSF